MSHAPDGGYKFAAKESEYRRRQGIAIDRLVSTPRNHRRVVYLDTAEAGETRHLVSGGYSPFMLHAVNSSPAEVAWLTRRALASGIKGVNTHGKDLKVVVEDLVSRGQSPQVVIYDSTSYLSKAFLTELQQLVEALPRPVALGVTVVAGREHDFAMSDSEGIVKDSFGADVNPNHKKRALAIATWATGTSDGTCLGHVADMMWHVYKSSSGRPMLWVALKIVGHRADNRRTSRSSMNKRLPRPCCDAGPTTMREAWELIDRVCEAKNEVRAAERELAAVVRQAKEAGVQL